MLFEESIGWKYDYLIQDSAQIDLISCRIKGYSFREFDDNR